MKKTEIVNAVSRTANKLGFGLKKHSPEILVVAGIAGTVASTVLACKATLKVNDILTETKDNLDKIHSCSEDPEMADKYSEDDHKKDTAIVYAQTGIKLARLYAPAIVVGSLSITGILASNKILRKRNVALAAAYATVDRTFKEYRSRVVDRFGEQVDHELRYNIKAKEFEEKTVDGKGKEKTVKKEVAVSDVNEVGDFARYFDDRSPCWNESADMNMLFLRSEQSYANDLLKIKGFLTLNEVYERLGLPLSKAGMVVGWIYDKDNPVGDNYVDFGLYETSRESVRDFVNGYTNVVLLDFNVDGDVYSRI